MSTPSGERDIIYNFCVPLKLHQTQSELGQEVDPCHAFVLDILGFETGHIFKRQRYIYPEIWLHFGILRTFTFCNQKQYCNVHSFYFNLSMIQYFYLIVSTIYKNFLVSCFSIRVPREELIEPLQSKVYFFLDPRSRLNGYGS